MIRSLDCLRPEEVETLLSGELSDERTADVESHLSCCDACRRVVEHAIGPDRWWDDVRESLVITETVGDAGSNDASASLCWPENDSPADAPADGATREGELLSRQLLDLLGPTDDPHSLGRIGPYEVVALLGQGGMGAVFKGLDPSLNRYVAIKILLPTLAASGAARKRFAREAQAVAAVVDDHVMAIHSVSEWQGIPYLVMPYARGATLQKRLAAEGPLKLAEILRIGMQAARGLAASHAQGIIHRDVKPANIFLDDNVERVQLMDFGLARAVDDASVTRTGVLAGTPQYMSPEQARAESLDRRSDLFSLGAVMYAMCTGRPPFRADSSHSVLRLITDREPRPIRELNPEIPAWLCSIIARLMAKDPADRHDSAQQLAALLEACLAHVQDPQAAPLPPELATKKSTGILRRGDKPRGIAGLMALGAVGAVLLPTLFLVVTSPPSLAGRWQGEAWSEIDIRESSQSPHQYEGEFTGELPELLKKLPEQSRLFRGDASRGEFQLRWSRVERRFNGTWKSPDGRFGRLSLRLDGEGEIRGARTTSKPADDDSGPPRLTDLHWRRAAQEPSTGVTEKPSAKPAKDTELAAAVRQFNSRQQQHALGKRLPPLTVEEVATCIHWMMNGPDFQYLLSAEEQRALRSIAEQGKFPRNWKLDVVTEVHGVESERFAAWNVTLQLTHADGTKFTRPVREQLLWQIGERGDPVALPKPAIPAGWRPLAAALRTFNSAHRVLDGVPMPPVTEHELLAAIRLWKSRRLEFDITNEDFATLQAIADNRALPPGAELEIISHFGPEAGPVYLMWSVRLSLLKTSNTTPYPRHVEEFRRHHVGMKDQWERRESMLRPRGIGFVEEPTVENQPPPAAPEEVAPAEAAPATAPPVLKPLTVGPLDRLQGAWQCLSLTRDGQPVAADVAAQFSLDFNEDQVVFQEQHAKYTGRVELPDSLADALPDGVRPLMIRRLVGGEEVIKHALFEFRGEQLRIVTNVDGKVPTAMESKPQSVNQLLLVFERHWGKQPLALHVAHDRPGAGRIYVSRKEQPQTLFVEREPIVTIKDVIAARIKEDSPYEAAIDLTFSEEAAERMGEATGKNLNKHLVIFLEGELVAAPAIRARVGARAVITGKFDPAVAKRIVAPFQGEAERIRQLEIDVARQKVKIAEQELEQTKKLVEKNFVSRLQVDQAELKLRQAELELQRVMLTPSTPSNASSDSVVPEKVDQETALKLRQLNLQEAEMNLKAAEETYRRTAQLTEAGAVTAGELLSTRREVEQAALAVSRAKLILEAQAAAGAVDPPNVGRHAASLRQLELFAKLYLLEVQEAELKVRAAKETFDRLKKLADQGAAPHEQLLQARRELEQAELGLERVKLKAPNSNDPSGNAPSGKEEDVKR
ncbi:MAG: protein kinase [Planctomycetales bacterium]|nr:protein kinase [Planctomycetales bacterium]